MASRDVERLVRTMVAQRVDREYIKHYLQETYQLDDKAVEEVLNKLAPANAARGGRGGKSPEDGAAPPIKRQRFY
jgi:ATP-dependent protease HslVU (ClpYQ) ATPase subunit